MSPCSFSRFRGGGDEQNRTVDPLLARQVLSQLSYTPKVSSGVSLRLSEDLLIKTFKIEQYLNVCKLPSDLEIR